MATLTIYRMGQWGVTEVADATDEELLDYMDDQKSSTRAVLEELRRRLSGEIRH